MQALAIDDRGRVSRGVEAWEGDTSAVSSERIDLAGRVVVPGFRLPDVRLSTGAGAATADGLVAVQRELRSLGVTGLVDASPEAATIRAWQRLDVDGRTTLRVSLAIPPTGGPWTPVPGFGSAHVRFGPLLIAGDGAADGSTEAPLLLRMDDPDRLVAALRALPSRPAAMTAVALDPSWTLDVDAWGAIDDIAALPLVVLTTTDGPAPPVLADCVRAGRAIALGASAALPPLQALAAFRRWTDASPAAALAALTANAARVLGFDERDGMLKPGYPADLTILDGDPLGADPADAAGVRVVATMVAGRWVYGRPPW